MVRLQIVDLNTSDDLTELGLARQNHVYGGFSLFYPYPSPYPLPFPTTGPTFPNPPIYIEEFGW